jgi:hypothetical protein
MRRDFGEGNTVHLLSGWVETRTARAVLLHSDFMEEPIWLPLSQVVEERELSGDINRWELVVRFWLIQKNGYA